LSPISAQSSYIQCLCSVPSSQEGSRDEASNEAAYQEKEETRVFRTSVKG
jgi:hypothetical protein